VEQVKSIYKQVANAVVGGILAGVIFASIFWRVSDHTTVLTWLACVIVFSLARVPPVFLFLARRNDENIHFWGNLYAFLTLLSASTFSVAFVTFIPVQQDPIYNVIVAMWIVGMSAGSVSAYTVHLKTLLAFFMPIVIPGTINLLIIGGQLNIYLCMAIGVYAVVVLRAMRPVNLVMIESIRLNFKLEDEIAERIKIEEKLIEISRKDGLTGLSNRRHFDEALAAELLRAQRNSQRLSLILIDIDYFKDFNDTYGHVAGDNCLKQLSRLIEEKAKRTGDVAARYGGDEIAVILPNTDATNAQRIAATILENVRSLCLPHEASSVADIVTVSAGVATTMPSRDTAPSDIIELADTALYKAKDKGRNQVE